MTKEAGSWGPRRPGNARVGLKAWASGLCKAGSSPGGGYRRAWSGSPGVSILPKVWRDVKTSFHVTYQMQHFILFF